MAHIGNDAAARDLQARVASLEAELEHARAELKNVQDSHHLFSNLVDLSPDAMMVQRADRRVVYINRSGVTMLGASASEEVVGSDFRRFIHADAQERAEADFRRLLTGELQHSRSVEQRWQDVHGAPFYADVFSTAVDWNGTPAVFIVAHDVTRRIVGRKRVKEAETRRNEAHQRLCDAIDTISEGFALFDAEGRLQLCNQKYVDGIGGIRRREVRPGMTFEEIVDQALKNGLWDRSDEPLDVIRARILARHQNLPSECDIRYPSGRWMRQSKKRTREGGVVAVYSDITDIKEQEQAQAERERLYRQMLEALPDAIVISENDRVVFINAAAVRLFGADSAEQLIGIDVHRLAPPGIEDIRRARREKVLTERCTLPPTEHQRLRLDGSVVDVESVSTFILWQGKPAILGVIRNITERKQAEAALAETERRLRAVTDNMPGAVFQRVLTADGRLHFPYVSAGIHEVTGLTPEEITQDTTAFFDRMREDFRDEFQTRLLDSAKGLTPVDIEVPIVKFGGEHRWIQSKGRPRKSANGDVVWDGIMIDITEQKLAEENARRSYHWLHEAMGNMPSAFLLWDPDDRLVLWNELAGKHHPVAEILREGLPFEDFLAPLYENIAAQRGRTAAAEWIEARRKQHRQEIGDCEFQGAGGRWFVLNERRTPEGFTVATLTDVTDRHHSEDRLRESEELHRGLLEALPDAVVVSVDTQVVFVNAAAVRLFGATDAAQLIGMNVHDLAPPELRDMQRERRSRVLAERCILPPHDQQRLRFDGTLVDVQTVASFIMWEGKPGYFAVLRDMTERRKADAVLAETQRRFSAVTDNIPGAVFQRVMSPDGELSFTYVSAGIKELTGLTPEEFMASKPASSVRIRADFREEYIARLKRSAETLEPLDIEIPGFTPDGRTRWLQSKGRPHRRDDGAVVWDGVVLDITEHKLAEENAVRTHRWLVEAIGSMPSGFMLWDSDDRLVLWNDLVQQYHVDPENFRVGMPFETMIGEVHRQLVDIYGQERADEWIAERRRQRQMASGEFEFRGIEGLWFEISERRTAEGFTVTLLTDVTERHEAEQRLRESEGRYRTLVNLSPDAVYVHRRGRIIVCNEAMVAMLGAKSADELIGRDVIDFVHPDIRDHVRRTREKSAKAGTRTTFGRQKRLRCDGSEFWAEVAAGAIEWDGERSGIVVMRDATEQMAAEEALVRSKEEAELANRAKTEFLANMSHELRTPLNAIIGFSDLMQREMLGPLGNEQYRGYLRDIYQSGTHLHDVINDILDLSKIEAGQLELREEPVDVAAAVERCLRVVSARAEEKNIVLQTRIGRNLPTISADERKVKQILINLISNAVKFTEQGGHVTVEAMTCSDGGICLRVTDTGIGIRQEDIPIVLQPFRQVDSTLSRRQEGTGLGLPLTKSLVELHGGSLTLTSEPGKGTTVTVQLPKSRSSSVPSAAE